EVVRRRGERARRIAFMIAAASIVLLTGTALFVASLRARRYALVVLGRRWCFTTKDCSYTVSVRSFDRVTRVELTSEDSPEPMEAVSNAALNEWPPQVEPIAHAIAPGSDVRVRVDEALFCHPWSKILGGPWSTGTQAVIAGQIATVGAKR